MPLQLNPVFKKITKLSYISLALFPLLKENYGSILIVICFGLTALSNAFIEKQLPKFSFKIFTLSIPFWFILFRELFSINFQIKLILLYLPFLVFPILFYNKPNYIGSKIKKISISIFQISLLIEGALFMLVFLKYNSIKRIFEISAENIPFFRDYVFNNYFFELHPTYFSIFLVISLTISLVNLRPNYKILLINALNIIYTSFFIFLLSSKMVIIILLITIPVVIALRSRKAQTNVSLKKMTIGILVLIFTLYISVGNMISKRFEEVISEINKPVEGLYYNSTNVRVAILKCSLQLSKSLPLWGYGNQLQSYLNNCYSENYDSDFYIKHPYNTHNYYFNILLYGGWFGLIVLLIYFYFISRALNLNVLGLIILAQIILINFTENFMGRHYGIITLNYILFLIIFLEEKNDYFSTSQKQNLEINSK